jgi:ribosomal protein S6--L-glutamate ligase
VKIAFLLARHPPARKSPIVPEVIRLLRDWGAAVDVIHPDEQVTLLSGVAPAHDLYVLKSETELALSLAGALHAAGAAIVNPYPVAAMLRDKVVATRRLEAAGVPVPATWAASSPRQLAALVDGGPIVVKPYRGTHGEGIRVVRRVDDLACLEAAGPVFAQRWHEPDGRDRKLYVVDGRVFGVMRRWPAVTYEEKLGEPFTVGPELRDLALRCGRAFGVELFGVDVVVSEGRPWVVDMQAFPGFKGVPDAALRLADFVYATAQRVLDGAEGATHVATPPSRPGERASGV